MQTLEQLQSGQLTSTKKLAIAAGLTEFPREILELAPTLEYLDLSNNFLTELPDDFVRLKNLKIAFFSQNDFTQFPAVLGACPNLEMIGFKACKIAVIPENAFPVNLRWLILTNNQITGLPASIGQCSRMQKLMLAGNKLKTLPPELAACHRLELLRIAANELTEFPDWLFTLPRLAWLALAGNPCSVLPAMSYNLPEIPWQDLEIAEPLGQGASGVIYKANWRKDVFNLENKLVAVKIFKGEVTSDGFPADEMQACIAAGPHHNLVPVLGKISRHPDQKTGLILELIPPTYKILGITPSFETCTRDHYPEGTVFSLPQLIAIVSGMASVGAHLHARGIMHGDFYPHNILINESANPLLGDFGAAVTYDKTDTGQAALLERIEVRALGYLLEDLLDHLDSQGTNQEIVVAFNNLKRECLREVVSQRPDFAAICQEIERVVS